MKDTENNLYLIDGTALIYRSYYAFIANPLRDKFGNNTSAIFGVANSFIKLVTNLKPQKIIISFDLKEPTFRHKMTDSYKANRPPVPDELISQIEPIKKIFDLVDIPEVSYEGFEADDVIATLAEYYKNDYKIIIVSGDKDFGQVVDDNVWLYDPFANRLLDKEKIYNKYGVKPDQFEDYLAIIGDSADNIPGIKGIGPKGASKLLEEYKSLDGIFENLSKINSQSIKDKLIKDKDTVYFSKKLVSIVTNVPLESQYDLNQLINDNNFDTHKFKKLLPLIKKYDLYSINKKIQDLYQVEEHQATEINPNKENNPSQEIVYDENQESVIDGHRGEDQRNEYSQQSCDFYKESFTSNIIVVDDESTVLSLIKDISKAKVLAYYIQIPSTTSGTAILLSVCIYLDHDKAYFLPVYFNGEKNIWRNISFDNDLFNLLFNNLELIIIHDLKKNYHVINHYLIDKIEENSQVYHYNDGIFSLLSLFLPDHKIHKSKERIKWFDIMIASYLLNAQNSNYELDRLIFKEFGVEIEINKEIVNGKEKLYRSSYETNCVKKSYLIYRLYEIQNKMLHDRSLANLFLDLEMPLVTVLAKMEEQGVYIDKDILCEINESIGKEIDKLTKKIYEIADRQFNINSPQQLSKILFEEMGIPPDKKTKTGYSTDNMVLEKLAERYEVASYIILYRQYTKLRSTYVEALPSMINSKTDRIHSTFNQTVTTTGRLSSSNPNLQNIPIRREVGRQIRKAFRSDKRIILSADYSQIELRLLGIMARDRNLIWAFNNKQDIHSQTAGLILGKPITIVSSDERRMAKTINFGIIYGMGPVKLSKEIGVSQKEARHFIEEYFRKFPTIKDFIRKQIEKAKRRGYAETLFGRRLNLPNLYSNNKRYKSEAERVAFNMPIQGTAADIIKIAMIRIDNRLEKLNHKINQPDNFAAKMIIQVHDELVFEVSEKYLSQVEEVIQEEMKNALPEKYRIIIPMSVDLGTGLNWYEAHN